MRKIGIRLILLAGAAALSPVYADNLMQVYSQAVKNDPLFAQARSTWESQKMNLPIAWAGYLPQLALSSSAVRDNTYTTSQTAPNANVNSWQYSYTVTLTQPVFDLGAWRSIKNAGASVKAATATYLAAQQSLMQRVATTYFNTLQAYDQLHYIIANKRAVWQQYETAREQFKVGLVAITDEYNARASYDQVVAQQIAAQNNLNISLESLRAITGREYTSLSALGKFKVARPIPDNINQWVHAADEHNYELKAQNYTVQAAMETIEQQKAGGYPVLDLQSVYSDTHESDSPAAYSTDDVNGGLTLTYKPIQGGAVLATTKQARYNYVTASGKLMQVHRTVVNQARTSFLSILSAMSRIEADRQSIISAKNSLEATQAGLNVGTRTMVDLLNALSATYNTEQQYATDQYDYINKLIALKAAAGTLCVQDLETINSWLGKSVQFPRQTSVGEVPSENGDTNYMRRNTEPAKHSMSTSHLKKTKRAERKHTTSITQSTSLIQPQLQLPVPHSTQSLPSPHATFLPAPGRA